MKAKFYFVILAFCSVVIYFGLGNLVTEKPEVTLTKHDQLIMYSLTGCSSCEEKRGELHRAKVPYVEYVVDRQPGAGAELMDKLNRAGFSPDSVGYPSFDVKGTLIPNNPPLIQIRKHLKDDDA